MNQTQDQAEASRTAARPALSTGRLVALVVVLAGLFGMHGLADDGSHAAGLGAGDEMVTRTTTAVPTVVGVATDAMSGGAMSVLCLAVLTAGALLLLLGSGRRRTALAQVPAPAPFTFLGSGRDRDPPSLTALSIRRC